MSDRGREASCPDCGSTERVQKFRDVICGGCRVVVSGREPTLAEQNAAEDWWATLSPQERVALCGSGRQTTPCVAPDCAFSSADGSAYCTLHGVKWGRGEHVHGWDALRSVPPSWRCAYCGEVTEVRP